jgi:cysteine synthase B
MPQNVSPERSELLRAYGAEIIQSPGHEGTNGAITMAKQIAAENKKYLMLYQYGNPANPQAHYETTGPEIIQDLPDVSHFVAGLGTGGTLMGTGRCLKEHSSLIRVIASAPEPNDAIQGLRSLEEGFVPPILDLNLLDARIMVSSEESFRMTAALLRQEGVFAGVSSGAVLSAALRVGERLESGKIVCLFADGGWKYLSSGLWSGQHSALDPSVRNKIWW